MVVCRCLFCKDIKAETMFLLKSRNFQCSEEMKPVMSLWLRISQIKIMINLLQLTVFFTKCYVLVTVTVKLNIYVDFQTIKSIISSYWPVLRPIVDIDLLQSNVFAYPSQHRWVYGCCNSLRACSFSDARGWKDYFGLVDVWRLFCLPYSQQFGYSAYFPLNIYRSRVVTTASQLALSDMSLG